MRLPLDGCVTVAWGGAPARGNHHVHSPAERWAVDLLVTIDGRSHAGAGDALTDYYAYDRPVRAPADGRIVAVHDGVPDAAVARPEPSRRGGNQIVVEVVPGEHLFLLHLRRGSIGVRAGDRVQRGHIVARVGNSGNSTEPHLHVHLQDSPVAGRGQAIPFHFADYVHHTSGQAVVRGMPVGGMRRGQWVGDIVCSREAPQPMC